MKRRALIGLAVVLLLAMAVPAVAGPPTMPPPGDHFTFNTVTEIDPITQVLGPNEILVLLDGSGMLGFVAGSPFQILDNDMTDGWALVQIPPGLYDTWDQARGKPGGELFWGNYHARSTGRPVWERHNDPGPLPIPGWGVGNWLFTNDGVTCYSFRLYPLP